MHMGWHGVAMRHGSILITRMEYCKMRTVGSPYMHAFFENK
jgi:hypothetical protein